MNWLRSCSSAARLIRSTQRASNSLFLLDCQLISLEQRVGGWRRPMLTPAGAHLLEATACLGRKRYGDAWTREDDNLI
jgi:hypothetical protein